MALVTGSNRGLRRAYCEGLLRAGTVSHPSAGILTHFGGLKVGTLGSGQECATSDVSFGELQSNTVRDLWTRLLRTELIGIAEIHNTHGELYIDREGRCYGASQVHDAFWFEGISFNEAMERILLGLRSRPMLRPPATIAATMEARHDVVRRM